MFQSEQLIYIHMSKTGGTHITSLLHQLLEGQEIGLHNAATQDQISSNTYFVSSIRNPWDWYLSLWTYGAGGHGSLMRQVTQRRRLPSIKSVIKNPKKNYLPFFRELSRDVTSWRSVYDDSNNVESFREWLKLIHNPRNSYSLRGGYAKTAISKFSGIMTHRYLKMCCRNVLKLHNPELISNYTDLAQFENANCYIDFFIRQESLENDLCAAIERVQTLTQEEMELIYSKKKMNTSERPHSISKYYDKDSVELIYRREKLLIDKFDYSPPEVLDQNAALD